MDVLDLAAVLDDRLAQLVHHVGNRPGWASADGTGLAAEAERAILITDDARLDHAVLDQKTVHRRDAPRPQTLSKTKRAKAVGGYLLHDLGDHSLFLVALVPGDDRSGLLLDLGGTCLRMFVDRKGAGDQGPQFVRELVQKPRYLGLIAADDQQLEAPAAVLLVERADDLPEVLLGQFVEFLILLVGADRVTGSRDRRILAVSCIAPWNNSKIRANSRSTTATQLR